MTARHDFFVVIPVADRPRQLAQCIDSLMQLLQRFPYAGTVCLLIADDSLDAAAIARHRALADAHSRAGLPSYHLDRATQKALIQALPTALQARLTGVLGRVEDYTNGHLGASVMRNLACLWLNRLPRTERPRLIWFVDSDERFQVEMQTAMGASQPHEIDYFNTLDHLFSTQPIEVLTGKVVGDPPVSPAVMAGTLLDDVLTLLSDLAEQDPHAPCSFHGPPLHTSGAAYHDMADLFGYATAPATPYRCPLPGRHDHIDCLTHLAAGLGQFFDGVHPSRRSLFHPVEPMTPAPARTVYTGNYVITESALTWFIPFAGLRLRMAGPTLGRLLKAALAERFVSANLPLWHGRTLAGLGRSECRPGVTYTPLGADLSDEFERQYFGDVMLFAIEALIGLGYPDQDLDAGVIRRELTTVEAQLQARYLRQQMAVAERIDRLQARLVDPTPWWRHEENCIPALDAIARFLYDLERNFGPKALAWGKISAPDYREARLNELYAAIVRLNDERAAWSEALQRV